MIEENLNDSKRLLIALEWAEARVYRTPLLEKAMFTEGYVSSHLMSSDRTWANGLVMSHDFAKAFFGHDLVSVDSGRSFQAIGLWAKQVAVEHLGKIIKADSERPYLELYTAPDVAFNYDAPPAPTELVDFERTVIQLRNIAASVPIRTHVIEDVDVIGGMPAWQYHLREMVVCENPYKYLVDYINREKKHNG